MLMRITGRALGEWMAYAGLEPFGERRADLRMGILAALIANVNRDPDKTEAFKAEDFMPDFEAVPEPPPDRERVAQEVDMYFSLLAEMGRGGEEREETLRSAQSDNGEKR
jgi:hypothetical protein